MLSVGRAKAQAQAGIIPPSCQATFHGRCTKYVIAPLPRRSREESLRRYENGDRGRGGEDDPMSGFWSDSANMF